jgi:formylglycine-generating enzyme required for sulfatase activity
LRAFVPLVGERGYDPRELAERSPPDLLRTRQGFGVVMGALDNLAARHADERDEWRRRREELRSRFIELNRLPPPSPAEESRLNPWVFLEGGEFRMGSPEGIGFNNNERPQHKVRVSPFSIQKFEVSNEEYRRFDPYHDPNAPTDHPVRDVDWYEATAYCAWLGGSLPTEAQWEFAARGAEGREYPWGDDPPTPERANYSETASSSGVEAVGSHPKGATPEGVQDLAGNVSEWCRDWYGPYSEEGAGSSAGGVVVDPPGAREGPFRVLRGGAFGFDPGHLRAASRFSYHPEDEGGGVGLRCVAAGAARGQD